MIWAAERLCREQRIFLLVDAPSTRVSVDSTRVGASAFDSVRGNHSGMCRRLPMLGDFKECVFMRGSRILGSCAGLILAVLPVQATPAAADSDPAVRAREIMGLTYQQFATTPHEPPFEWSADGYADRPRHDPGVQPA